jgi:hypothetical protein
VRVASAANATKASCARRLGSASVTVAVAAAARTSGYANGSDETNDAYSRSGTSRASAASASAIRRESPSRTATRYTGIAASDIANAPVACTARKAVLTSPISQAGAVRMGWRSAGKCAEPPRIEGLPDSAIERPIAE